MITPFSVTVADSVIEINNTPPTFADLPMLVELEPGEIKSFTLGEVNDYENNAAHLESWSVSETIDWLEFNEADSIESSKFSFYPPVQQKEMSFEISITIIDDHETSPMKTK